MSKIDPVQKNNNLHFIYSQGKLLIWHVICLTEPCFYFIMKK